MAATAGGSVVAPFAPAAFAPASDEDLLAAAGACPAVALTLVDGATGEQVYP